MDLRKLAVTVVTTATLVLSVGAAGAQEIQGSQRPAEPPVRAALDAAAAETGLTVEEIVELVAGGMTLAEVVTDNGGDVQAVIDAAVAESTQLITEAVAAGRISQQRADRLLANLEDMVTRAVEGELPGPGPRGGRGHGPRQGRDHVEGARLALMEAILEQTGLERYDVVEQVREGGTLAEVITNAGGDVDAVIDSALATASERLSQAVENGRLTQTQVDALLTGLEAAYAEIVEVNPVRERLERELAGNALALAAEETGMLPRDILTDLRGGAALADILAEQGVDVSGFITELEERAEARLNVLVADDRLSAEEAAEWLSEIRGEIEARINSPWEPPFLGLARAV